MGDLLKGKVAVVTGAARGIGEKTARLFAQHGATVRLWDLLPLVNDTATSIHDAGGAAAAQQVDITDSGLTVKAAQDIVSELGRIDVLVNCAGIFRTAMFLEMEQSLWDKIFAINVIGTANCCRAVLPSMIAQRSGRIVNISSVTGPMVIVTGGSAYGASKGAVSALTKALAVEMAPHGITVNAILPGTVATPMMKEFFLADGRDPDEALAEIGKMIPMRRVALPEDIAGASLMLASEYASYITGAELVVDGGFNLLEWG
jgi:NAD(P)-dependent dehydrogenase (short-subunit alcohol dehydrogenase family)